MMLHRNDIFSDRVTESDNVVVSPIGAIARRALLLASFALLLLWPLAINRTAVLYPDSGRYLMNGLNLWDAVARHGGKRPMAQPSATAPVPATVPAGPVSKPKVTLGGRSPYYGAFVWGARGLGGLGAIAVAQALWLALVLVAALPRLDIQRARDQVATVALLAVFSPLAFFVDVIMPDIFVGVAVVSVLILWCQWPTTSRGARAWWLANIVAAALFHSSFLVLSGALVAVLALSERRAWRDWRRPAVAIAAALGLAAVGTAAMNAAIKAATGRPIMPIPYLLARTIGDGTAARVLVSDCPTRHFATCRVVDQLPLTENEFLWGRPGLAGWNTLDPAAQDAIGREQGPIVAAALRRYPGTQLFHSAGNAARMLLTSDLDEFADSDLLEHALSNRLFDRERAELAAGRLFREHLTLRPLSVFWSLSYMVATALVVAALVWCRRLRLAASTVRIATIFLLALVLSAAIHGIFGGVWGRYTARIAWLAVLALIVVGRDLWRSHGRTSHATMPAAP